MIRFNNFIILSVILLSVLGYAQQNPSYSYTMEQFKEKLKSDKEIVLLDVRTPEELSGHLSKIDGAINIPLQVLESRFSELGKYKDKEITVICRTQNRSAVAANILSKYGYNAKYVLGGMTSFRQK